jgi:nucleotide-binding universal stress UspA family protein
VDFSPCSADALSQAARLAKLFGGELRIVHGVDAATIDDLSHATGKSHEQVHADVMEGTRRELKRLTEELQVLAAAIDVQEGLPVDRVVEYVTEHKADLLVVCRTGASGVEHKVGSFAMGCARKSPSNVLVVSGGHSQRFARIAVGVDFSETSMEALRCATSLASVEKASVDAVHVFFGPWNRLHYRSPTIEVSDEFQKEYRRKIETQLNEFAAAPASECPGVVVKPVLAPDYSSAGFGFVKYLEHAQPDLAVVGTHGRKGLSRLLMGSTAERVVYDAPCSVLVAKPGSSKQS